jgi:hypothetical protein
VSLVTTYTVAKEKNIKAIPVTGRGRLLGCEASKLPHFPDCRLKDGGEDVNLKRRQPSPPLQYDSWYSFLLVAEFLLSLCLIIEKYRATKT